MNVVYGCDERYAPILYVSISSLFNENRNLIINVYVINENISKKSKQNIEKLISGKHNIIWLSMINMTKEIKSKIYLDRGSKAQYARIFIDKYLSKNIHRVLYLDCDTLIMGSLSELWETNLNHKTFGACLDAFNGAYNANLGLSKDSFLINSGVMLIDLDLWRKREKETQAVKILNKYHGKIQQGDQGLLDILVQKDLKILDPRFNCVNGYFEFTYDEWIKYRKPGKSYCSIYDEALIKSAVEHPSIVHFTSSFLNNRPWIMNAKHKFLKEWIDEIKKSDFEITFQNKKSLLKIIFEKLPRKFAVSLFGILQAHIRPLIRK